MFLDMAPYMEHNLIPNDKQEMSSDDVKGSSNSDVIGGSTDTTESYDYELIGVTVHTGTADGGHYYAFIREQPGGGGCASQPGASAKKWFSFNDAEVKVSSERSTFCQGNFFTVKQALFIWRKTQVEKKTRIFEKTQVPKMRKLTLSVLG